MLFSHSCWGKQVAICGLCFRPWFVWQTSIISKAMDLDDRIQTLTKSELEIPRQLSWTLSDDLDLGMGN